MRCIGIRPFIDILGFKYNSKLVEFLLFSDTSFCSVVEIIAKSFIFRWILLFVHHKIIQNHQIINHNKHPSTPQPNLIVVSLDSIIILSYPTNTLAVHIITIVTKNIIIIISHLASAYENATSPACHCHLGDIDFENRCDNRVPCTCTCSGIIF